MSVILLSAYARISTHLYIVMLLYIGNNIVSIGVAFEMTV
ncbi:hypothetical protein ymoll0001_14760 [Yersinia mollaretii ATCC 43969]|uniref:Uncharacterized protein n=1 Tax=Yersinia mollaretii (strain ATCC 43969 / DSM 18520 / CIP 103324 / CNY 7263 / WAIP 204) TaxID=349967 RepID=A0ABP2EAT5_YERMW|nr:hypothetical protein ymoll0001_14760 [Yersinia mollaretii ATCC 43969]